MFTLIVAVLVGLSTLTAPTGAPAPGGPPCDVPAVVAAVDARSGASWGVAEQERPYLATTGPGSVWVDPDTPCALLPSVIVHEWMHLLQFAAYGDPVLEWTAQGVELVADCGSLMFGVPHRPYAARDCQGCPPVYAAEARRLIGDQAPPLP